MKNCKSFQKQLTAYLHGELPEPDFQALEAHLATCATCRAELATQRATLELLAATLEAAPAPERLVVWKPSHKPVRRPQNTFARFWFSPWLGGVMGASAMAAVFFLLSGMFVVFTVVQQKEVCFEPPKAVGRPKMKLRKPKVRVRKSSMPKPTARIVSKMRKPSMPNIQLPEMSGMSEGLGSDIGGFDMMADLDGPMVFGSGQSIGDASESIEVHDYYFGSPTVARPRLEPQKIRVSDAEMPTIAGIKGGLGLAALPMAEPVPAAPEAKEESTLWSGTKMDDGFGGRKRQARPAVFNPYMLAAENAFSTFSIDVDTASYGLARNALLIRRLPEAESVRTEEFINSFDYDYRPPAGSQTFAIHTEMAPSPFRMGMDILKIGIKGRRIGRDDHRGAVLTLVVDTSGSMATPERLGLVKQSLALLIDQLDPSDEVAIVQFGGEARLVLEHTPASEKAVLLEAINGLQPSGPTQLDKGLELGYTLAKNGFKAGDSNRIMILSDGVANLGELDPEAILEQVAQQRKKGIYLSVLGFGAGAYDDDMLEQLANKGDGSYAYIDTLDEARRLLVDQLAATLHVIASDVKIQVEFNPARVLRYRQLGYENRQLTKEQFRDDSVDAGEVGSGQSVTALYDVELDPDGPADEPIATVYVRYRRADTGTVEEISSRVLDTVRKSRFEDATPRFQLAACTAEFAEHLRRSPYAEGTELSEIAKRLLPVVQALELDKQVKELMRIIQIANRMEK